MINIYIDDSGTSNLKDSAQPFFLFSAVLIKNKEFNKINIQTESLVNKLKMDINNIIAKSLSSQKYELGKQEKISNMITEKVLGKKFELHCAQLLRGDDSYMILQKEDRYKYIEDALKIIQTNNIDVITVYCEKFKYLQLHNDKTENENQDIVKTEISRALIEAIGTYLKENNEQGCIIIDEGNDTIKKIFIPMVHQLSLDNISSEVLEKESFCNYLIQLADVCAYITNYNFTNKSKEKKKDLANRFYQYINNNNKLLNISSNDINEKMV